jgi:thiol-disulfide isomerase/thioredoxin
MKVSSLGQATVLTLLVMGCGGAGGTEVPTPAPTAVPAPIATVRKVDREGLKTLVRSASGKPRVVNFWATWCGPCVAEIPEILAFAEAHPEAEVVMVNLDYTSLTASHVVPFVERHQIRGVEVVQVDDADPAAAVTWAVPEWTSAIPYTMVVAPDGMPVARHGTAIDRAKLERGLELALAPR